MVPTRSPLRRRLAVAALVASTAVALAGCSATNPITSNEPYAASDGVRVEVGDVTAENLFVLTTAAGEVAALQGAFTNRGSERVTVTMTTADGSPAGSVPVAAGTTVLLGGDGELVDFIATDPPGAVTDLTIVTEQYGTLTVAVPVLDGTLPEYASLVPTPESTRG